MQTLANVVEATGFGVLDHLDKQVEVPVVAGMQAQGDLFVIPTTQSAGSEVVPLEGIPVIEAIGGGHEHRLFAGEAGTAYFRPLHRGADIGVLKCDAPAYLLHPEHGATGIAPGTYMLRRQREQAEEERLVAD